MPIDSRIAAPIGPLGNSGLAPTAHALFPSSVAAQALGRIGRLRVLGELGRGGMGVVYRVEDPDLQRERAVKVMHAHLAANANSKERFLREARAAATVEHPSIIPIYEVGEADGLPYLVMPLLRGRTLADWCRGRGPLPPARWLRIGASVADGLAAVHSAGLVHRDVKPSNVWLEAGDRRGTYRGARLLDFGLARAAGGATELTDTGEVLGTVGYMAPEQVTAQALDHRTDIFALGCILYELGAGVRPFAGATSFEVARRTVTDQPRPLAEINPLVSAGLSNFVLSLLSKERDDRPPTAAVVRDTLRDIDVVVRGKADSALTGSTSGIRSLRRPAPARRFPWLWVAIATVGLLTAVAWRFAAVTK
jgi:serine/threonine protein kinase